MMLNFYGILVCKHRTSVWRACDMSDFGMSQSKTLHASSDYAVPNVLPTSREPAASKLADARTGGKGTALVNPAKSFASRYLGSSNTVTKKPRTRARSPRPQYGANSYPDRAHFHCDRRSKHLNISERAHPQHRRHEHTLRTSHPKYTKRKKAQTQRQALRKTKSFPAPDHIPENQLELLPPRLAHTGNRFLTSHLNLTLHNHPIHLSLSSLPLPIPPPNLNPPHLTPARLSRSNRHRDPHRHTQDTRSGSVGADSAARRAWVPGEFEWVGGEL